MGNSPKFCTLTVHEKSSTPSPYDYFNSYWPPEPFPTPFFWTRRDLDLGATKISLSNMHHPQWYRWLPPHPQYKPILITKWGQNATPYIFPITGHDNSQVLCQNCEKWRIICEFWYPDVGVLSWNLRFSLYIKSKNAAAATPKSDSAPKITPPPNKTPPSKITPPPNVTPPSKSIVD